MHSTLVGLAGLAFGQFAAAQTSLVTVYLLLENRDRPSSVDAPDTTWTASVVAATPSATTYRLEHEPLELGIGTDSIQSIITVVNGPSTFAQWRVHDGSSTYGESCDITANPEIFNCNVTYLGARGSGGGPDSYYTTSLETASNTRSREWIAIAATITDGERLFSSPTAPPGQYLEVVTDVSAIGTATIGTETTDASATGTDGEAVATPSEGSGASGRSLAVPLLVAGVLGSLLV